MNYPVRWTEGAQKELRRLDRKTQERITQAVARFADSGHGDVRRVLERPGEMALRIGDWRVFFREVEEQIEMKDVKVLSVLRIRSRGHAYGR